MSNAWKRAGGLVVGALTMAGSLMAEESSVIVTPQQIVHETLDHSPRLRILGQEIVASDARYGQARAQGGPHFGADARASSYAGPEDSRFGPGFSIPFIENRSGAGITVSQPLYAGGRIKNAKEAATQQKSAAEQDQRGAEADLVLQALTGYWSWSQANEVLASLQAGVARMETHAQDMSNLHRAGLATETESLATAVQLDQTRLRYEEARRRRDVARARIQFLTGHPLPENATPVSARVLPDFAVPAEAELLGAAMTNRSERAARRRDVRAAEAGVKISRADYFPQVSLVARYEQARPNLLSIPPENRWQEDAFAGVAMSWSLFDCGLTKAKVTEATARVAQAKARLEQTDEEIALQVREARFNLQTARDRAAVTERVEQSARRNLQSATSLWRSGLARHADVLDAHAQLTDAQFEVGSARADWEVARATLERAVGRLEPAVRAGQRRNDPPAGNTGLAK